MLLPVLFSASIVSSHGGMLPLAISYATLTLVLVALTRGRLGYQRYRQDVLVPATAHGNGANEILEVKEGT